MSKVDRLLTEVPKEAPKLAGLFYSPTLVVVTGEECKAAFSCIWVDTFMIIAGMMARVGNKRGFLIDNTMMKCSCLTHYQNFFKKVLPDIKVTGVTTRMSLQLAGFELAVSGVDKATAQPRCVNMIVPLDNPDAAVVDFLKLFHDKNNSRPFEKPHRSDEYAIIERATSFTVFTPMEAEKNDD